MRQSTHYLACLGWDWNTRHPEEGGVGKVARRRRGPIELDSFGQAWPRRISGSVFYRGIWAIGVGLTTYKYNELETPKLRIISSL